MTDNRGNMGAQADEAEVAAIFGFDEPAPAAEQPVNEPASGNDPATDTPEAGQQDREPPKPASSGEAGTAPVPSPETSSGAAPAASTPPAPPVLPGVQPAPSSAPSPAASPDAAGEVALLRQQVAAMQAMLAKQQPVEQQGQQPTAGRPAAEDGTGDGPAEAAPYSLTIPTEVTSAIFSEDPQQAQHGLTHLVNSLATAIHRNVEKQFRTEMGAQFSGLREAEVGRQREQTRQSMQEQYFAAHPAHRDPYIQQLLPAIAAQVAVENPGVQWGPDQINAIGARVEQVLASFRGQPAAGQPAPPAANAPQAPAPMLPVGARHGSVAGTADEERTAAAIFG